jgi:hypothetical protein
MWRLEKLRHDRPTVLNSKRIQRMMAAKFEQLMLNIMSRFPNRQFTSPTVIAWSEQTAREYSPGKALSK